jgi:hypothetical protein
MNRRELLAASAAAAAPASCQPSGIDPAILRRHDDAVERYLKLQNTDRSSSNRGGIPDDYGLYMHGSGSGLLDVFLSAWICPQSKFHHNPLLLERARMAIDFMARKQTPDGNWDLLTTNFNSTPDAGFIMEGLCANASNARRYGAPEIAKLLEPVLLKAGDAMSRGGIHTPNHRWVVSAALAQLNELYPNRAYVRRIDQWLAEGIDIDSDGQYTERSTGGYNAICDRAFVLLALKLNRAELLDPVRRNLNSMLHLLHPGYEVVTEISRRQDLNTRVSMAPYWFTLAHMAVKDRDGRYALLARHFAPQSASLSALLEYPELANLTLPDAPLPDQFERYFPHLGVTRIRRGPVSISMIDRASRWLSFRKGDAVVNGVRFASAFFGKSQFASGTVEKREGGFFFVQRLDAGYWQPLDPPRTVGTEEWAETRIGRRRTEVCNLEQSAFVAEKPGGLSVRLRAHGTSGVPLAVEVNLRDGGRLEGVEPVKGVADAWLLASGHAVYRMGSDVIRFGPGGAPHRWTQIRGGEPKLPGPSVYITGFTPFDLTLDFDWA